MIDEHDKKLFTKEQVLDSQEEERQIICEIVKRKALLVTNENYLFDESAIRDIFNQLRIDREIECFSKVNCYIAVATVSGDYFYGKAATIPYALCKLLAMIFWKELNSGILRPREWA